jgi:hypothetical protein
MTGMPITDLESYVRDWKGVTTRYGVTLIPLGEDGDVLVAPGHVEPRRLAAAVSAYCRSNDGWFVWSDRGMAADAVRDAQHLMAAAEQPCAEVHDEDCATCGGSALRVSWAADRNDRTLPVTVVRTPA